MKKVGIISSGDMGSAVGMRLNQSGVDVYTSDENRSSRTIQRAEQVGIKNAGSIKSLVSTSDILLSIVPPGFAFAVASRILTFIGKSDTSPVFIECNAISPATMRKISLLFAGHSNNVIDAGIIGGPPTSNTSPRFYCSGPSLDSLSVLSDSGLDIRILGPNIGDASAFKMLYAASTKGTTALWTQLMIAAKILDLEVPLLEEFQQNRSEISNKLLNEIPRMPRRSARWISEMEEIANTFKELGMTPKMMEGAAEIFELVSETELSNQTSDEADPTLEFTMGILAEHVKKKSD